MPSPDLSHLDEAFIERMQQTRNPHLAIEALRGLSSRRCARSPGTTSSGSRVSLTG